MNLGVYGDLGTYSTGESSCDNLGVYTNLGVFGGCASEETADILVGTTTLGVVGNAPLIATGNTLELPAANIQMLGNAPGVATGASTYVDIFEITTESFDPKVREPYRREIIISGSFNRDITIEGSFRRSVSI